jgi:hypothetical protein
MNANYYIILAKLYFNEGFLVTITKSKPQGHFPEENDRIA